MYIPRHKITYDCFQYYRGKRISGKVPIDHKHSYSLFLELDTAGPTECPHEYSCSPKITGTELMNELVDFKWVHVIRIFYVRVI